MKVKCLAIMALLCLALSVPAMAEVKTFGNIKVDVPADWNAMELPGEQGGVVLQAPDHSAMISIIKGPAEGTSLADAANQMAQMFNTKAEKTGDNVYVIKANVAGADTITMLVDAKGDGKEFSIITVAGNHKHPAVDGIMNSIE